MSILSFGEEIAIGKIEMSSSLQWTLHCWQLKVSECLVLPLVIITLHTESQRLPTKDIYTCLNFQGIPPLPVARLVSEGNRTESFLFLLFIALLCLSFSPQEVVLVIGCRRTNQRMDKSTTPFFSSSALFFQVRLIQTLPLKTQDVLLCIGNCN